MSNKVQKKIKKEDKTRKKDPFPRKNYPIAPRKGLKNK